jgi:hypothetical protein
LFYLIFFLSFPTPPTSRSSAYSTASGSPGDPFLGVLAGFFGGVLALYWVSEPGAISPRFRVGILAGVAANALVILTTNIFG